MINALQYYIDGIEKLVLFRTEHGKRLAAWRAVTEAVEARAFRTVEQLEREIYYYLPLYDDKRYVEMSEEAYLKLSPKEQAQADTAIERYEAAVERRRNQLNKQVLAASLYTKLALLNENERFSFIDPEFFDGRPAVLGILTEGNNSRFRSHWLAIEDLG